MIHLMLILCVSAIAIELQFITKSRVVLVIIAFNPIGDPTLLSQLRTAWKKHFETYIVALNITDAKQKKALLLYQAGQQTQEIFDTLLIRETITRRLLRSSMSTFYLKRTSIMKLSSSAKQHRRAMKLLNGLSLVFAS